jgi:hypothetical protein
MFDYWGFRYIKEARETILNESNPNWEKDVRVSMSKVYRYYKKKLSSFKGNIKIILKILDLENLLENKFLPIDSKPILYRNFEEVDVVNDADDAENVVKSVVFNERVRLALSCDGSDGLEKSSLSQQCLISTSNILDYCEQRNIPCARYCCSYTLGDGRFHCFCILDFKLSDGTMRSYLVDCTYRQFFTYRNSFLERTGLVGFAGCGMGRFMLMNDSRKKTAEQLLKYGYMELSADNIKNYFDGFIFEGRNGKYYEKKRKEFLDESDYDVEYSFEDYLDAIDGKITLPEKYSELLPSSLSNPDIVFDYELYSNSKDGGVHKQKINK